MEAEGEIEADGDKETPTAAARNAIKHPPLFPVVAA
jgi:hypothetical protein